jgi:hypothetical protein
MFSYLAALTTRLELVSGVIILPKRQTALVAKQAFARDSVGDRKRSHFRHFGARVADKSVWPPTSPAAASGRG